MISYLFLENLSVSNQFAAIKTTQTKNVGIRFKKTLKLILEHLICFGYFYKHNYEGYIQ